MFTGLIEDLGTLRQRQRHRDGETLTLGTSLPTAELVLGESIAVNGCCLTVTEIHEDAFVVDASTETLRRSSIGSLQPGAQVHLERAMKLGDRLGGHIVQGHVDGVGTIERVIDDGRSWQVYVRLPAELMPEVVEKGSLAVDGVSLTVNELTASGCRLTIIPFTATETLLTRKGPGTPVNIETDVIGKHVRRLLEFGRSSGGSTASLLERYGYTDQ